MTGPTSTIFTVPQVLDTPYEVPLGGHVLSFYSSDREASDQAVAFVSGAPEGLASVYFVDRKETADDYNARLERESPNHVGCVLFLEHEQVVSDGAHLRPAAEVVTFLGQHPDGVSAAGDTISRYWDAGSLPQHLEYERWFQEQPRASSRFLCPYDLRRVPADEAPGVLGELGKHHSHVVLSSSAEPAVRLLQLFVFGTPGDLPKDLGPDLEWAQGEGFVHDAAADEPLVLTPEGRSVVREWADRTTVDW